MVEVGQKFRVQPAFTKGPVGMENTSKTGTVVYVRPQGRYAVREFKGVHGESREAFSLWDLLHKKGRKDGGK